MDGNHAAIVENGAMGYFDWMKRCKGRLLIVK